MNRADPFYGYSFVLTIIVYVLTPAFLAVQVIRLRRALHVFQLEGYKRARFLRWSRQDWARRLFVRRITNRKPLVMTGRARRLLATSIVLTGVLVVIVAELVHVAAGWPFDVAVWLVAVAACAFGLPYVLLSADVALAPLQGAINRRHLNEASGRLAEIHPTVIGVTGSFGKTSTKFAIAGIVGRNGAALATPGSYNTPLGVCRTINEQLSPGHEFLVVEMGAYGEGEIAELCRFVRPSIGVLTAIGPAHLERFGSLEAIRRAKYELVASLPSDGTAVMNVDDAEVR